MEDLEKINALIVFSKEGTLSKTAEKLRISQPSLTRTMTELEERLGVALFDRTRNSISLNETGQYAVERLRMLLNNIENIREDIVNYDSVNKALIIESQLTYLPELRKFLKDVGNTFSKKYEYRQKTEEELILDLREGNADVVFLANPVSIDGYKCRVFLYDNLSVCVPPSHALAQKASVRMEDLKEYSFIAERNPSYWMETVCRELGDPFFVKVENTRELELLMRESSLPSIGTQKCCAQCEYRKYRKSMLIQGDKCRIVVYIIYKPGNRKLEDIIEGSLS